VKRAAALLAALAFAADARAAEPACRATVSLDPARAVVGQQVRHRVRIERRDDVRDVEWLEPPVFANARAELLPPEPQPRIERDGVGYEVYDERRALFPERGGRFALPPASLRCQLAGGAQEIRVPGAALEVEEPPAAGRPGGYGGLVGPMLLSLSVTPERVALGGSLRVALMARGTGNLWVLDAPPFPSNAFSGADVFERTPELAFERGRELFVRQHLAVDLVPRRSGPLRIPALAVTFYDPERGAYLAATTEEVVVTVVESEASAAEPAERARGAAALAPRGGGRTAALLAVAAAGFAIGGVAAWWVRRRRAAEDLPARELENAARAHAAGDATAALGAHARALRAALSRHVPGAAALSVEELMARDPSPAVRAAVELLARVEQARYDRAAPAPAPEQIERAVRALTAGAGGAPSGLGSLFAVLLALGCAGSGTSPGDPMTPARLETLLRDQVEGVEEVEVDDQLRFVHDGVRMICVWDVRADRLRVVAAVAEESALTVASARILLQANFGNTLDARYAIRDGVLYAVYLHPLSTVDARELESALDQVAALVRNYGTSYSAAGGR
jgi:hypothetical protein